MALNGLDHANIQEAFTAASSETGGWFLLKYASRDEVELHEDGTGGINECRNSIANYETASPLYGFLKYRRRSVILKYMPEDCSRLIQARAAVHFTAICEQFMPHDTVFEISTPSDLKDSKLSSACSLHAASGSQSSSSSSTRRRRLGEIAEEDEEDERGRKRQSVVHEEDRPSSPSRPSAVNDDEPPVRAQTPVVLDPDQATSTEFATTVDVPVFEGVEVPSSPDSHRRMSSQSARTERYGSSYRPKVKLGPRPSLEATNRPHSADNFRPTAALPAGFKGFSKGSKKGKTDDKSLDDEQDNSQPVTPDLSGQAFIIPEDAAADHISLPPRPATSSGASIKSMSTIMSTATKENKMTPEKARLMKAMKMREKKKKMSASQPGPPPTQDLPPPPRRDSEDSMDKADSILETADGPKPGSPVKTAHTAESHTTAYDATSDHSASDSRPQSAAAASVSEVGDSTKASSISDSTDETVHARKPSIGELSDGEDDGPEEISEILEEAGLDLHASEQPIEAAPTAMTSESTDVAQAPISNTRPLAEVELEKQESTKSAVSPISMQAEKEGYKEPLATANRDVSSSSEPAPAISSASHGQTPLPSPTEKSQSGKSSGDQKSVSSKSPRTPSLKSRFSTQDLRVSSSATEPVPPLPQIVAHESTSSDPSRLNDNTHQWSIPEPSEEPTLQPPPRKSLQRETSIEPIETNIEVPKDNDSDSDDSLDDADLMDEIATATVEEAKPMMVSKSPIVPVFPTIDPPGKPSRGLSPQPPLTRTVSNPLRGPLLVPSDVSQSSARSVSAGGAAFLHNITRQPSGASLQSKKGNVGSSISQRIKALEQLSTTPGGPVDTKARPVTPSSTFFAVRKASVRQPSQSPSVTDRANVLSSQCPTPEPQNSRPGTPVDITPEFTRRERTNSMANRLSMFEGHNMPRGRPESIQVTARILRDGNDGFLKKLEPHKTGLSELKQSPLVIDTYAKKPKTSDGISSKSGQLSDFTKEPLPDRKKSADQEEYPDHRRRSSLNIVRGLLGKSADSSVPVSPSPASIKSPSRASTFVQGARRGSASKDIEHAGSQPTSPPLLSDNETEDETKGDKKDTRTSRFMRRFSSSFGGVRKATPPAVSPTVAEEPTFPTPKQAAPAAFDAQQSIAAYIGDVNVQFPDNLLWKRRSLCLDTQGWLILSAVQGATAGAKDKLAGAGVKRYHMSEFKRPYAPDVEVQELPNSVVLDLIQGSCLQVACGDRSGQTQTLDVLLGAHQKHSSFGQ